MGRKVKKVANGQETNYTRFGRQMLSEEKGWERIVYYQTPGLDQIVQIIRNWQVYTTIRDQIGSVVGVMNNSWTIVQSYRYDLWGNGEVQDGTGVWKSFDAYTGVIIAWSALWTSREYDKDINKYYLRNRRYDPSTSRFLTRDPLGYTDDTNMYRYVANSPLMYTDPMGLAAKSLAKHWMDALQLLSMIDPGTRVRAWATTTAWLTCVASTVSCGWSVTIWLGAAIWPWTQPLLIFIAPAAASSCSIAAVSCLATPVTYLLWKEMKDRGIFAEETSTPTSDPDSFTRLKNGQWYLDEDWNIRKKDMLHKDHWDISNSKWKKIREIDFGWREIRPNWPKNKNKTS
jgi:RHS repeat-associated protein